jgi:hypothetical protein
MPSSKNPCFHISAEGFMRNDEFIKENSGKIAQENSMERNIQIFISPVHKCSKVTDWRRRPFPAMLGRENEQR